MTTHEDDGRTTHRWTRVVVLACRAPSVHNTQPWHWRIVDAGHPRAVRRPRSPAEGRRPGRSQPGDQLRCRPAPRHRGRTCPGRLGDARALPRSRRPGPARPDHLHPDPPAGRRGHPVADAGAAPHRPAAFHLLAGARGATAQARRVGVRAGAPTPIPITDVTARFRAELLMGRAMIIQARRPALRRRAGRLGRAQRARRGALHQRQPRSTSRRSGERPNRFALEPRRRDGTRRAPASWRAPTG